MPSIYDIVLFASPCLGPLASHPFVLLYNHCTWISLASHMQGTHLYVIRRKFGGNLAAWMDLLCRWSTKVITGIANCVSVTQQQYSENHLHD